MQKRNKMLKANQLGENLENLVQNKLLIKKTKGSGNVKHDADLKDESDFIFECKYRSKKNVIIEKDWIDEIKKQAELCDRNWVIVNQTEDKKIYVTVDLETFKELYNAFKDIKYANNNK